MDYHHHARLTIYVERNLQEKCSAGELSLNSAAAEFKLSRQSAAKWVRRFREGGSSRLAGPVFAAASIPPHHFRRVGLPHANNSDASAGPGCASLRPPA